MEDQTPLNLEDSPKLFGLRYDQLIACLGGLIVGTQLYSWMVPIMVGPHDLRLYIAIFFGLCGPAYCLFSLNNQSGYWDGVMNFYMSSQVFIPGPDPNPVRFLKDEVLPEYLDLQADDSLEIEFNAFIENTDQPTPSAA